VQQKCADLFLVTQPVENLAPLECVDDAEAAYSNAALASQSIRVSLYLVLGRDQDQITFLGISGNQSLESATEVFDGGSGLTKDRAQRPAGELVMERDDRSPSSLIAKLHVTAALADLLEAQPLKCSDRLAAGDDRQPVCHALRSSVAMIGGSISVGSG
jgi:hypothetical protein